MGNCIGTCFGQAKKKTNYFVGRYKDYNVSIEFENLIDDDSNPSGETAVLTESERQHLLNKRFTDIEIDQRRKDAEIDAELHRQEENLRIEEDAYIDARREAARIAKQARAQQQDKKKKNKVTANGSAKSSWLGDDEDWDVAGGEDDFEMFLDSVKARSQAVRANVESLVCATNRPITNIPGHKESVTSTNSADLEWEYEEGFPGRPVGSSQPYRKGENVLAKSTPIVTPSAKVRESGSSHQQQQQQQQQQQIGVVNGQDSDLEWDGDFVSADTEESVPAMSGGMTFGGTDSVTRTSENSKSTSIEQHAAKQPGKVTQSGKTTEKVPSSGQTEKVPSSGHTEKVSTPGPTEKVSTPGPTEKVSTPGPTEKVPTPGLAGSVPTPAVQSVSSSASSSSEIISLPNQIPQTTTTTSVLSNNPVVQEPPARTENSAEAKNDGISEDLGPTKVMSDSTDKLEDFDIDKFLEELDFDT